MHHQDHRSVLSCVVRSNSNSPPPVYWADVDISYFMDTCSVSNIHQVSFIITIPMGDYSTGNQPTWVGSFQSVMISHAARYNG